MKRVNLGSIIILLILAFFQQICSASKFYIDPNGSDETGNGSHSNPWRTLARACDVAVIKGDSIYIRAGIYNENRTSELAPGVHLIGEGLNSIITSTNLTAEWTPIINMRSKSLQNGNQSISYLTFDGALIAAQAIWIERRDSVEIHNCTFKDFYFTGITWTGDGGSSGPDPYDNPIYPINYVKGSKFYNNTITNCAHNVPWDWGRGGLYIGGHENMLIYNNTITQTGRAPGYNGYPIKAFANGGFMKNLKLYNNFIAKEDPNANSWPFAIETAFWEGCEVFNNIIIGAIDINFMDKGEYNYSVHIHDNILGPEEPSPLNYVGIYLEFGVEDAIIERNHFRNCAVGIFHTMRYPEPWVKRVKVSYNLFSNLGYQSYHSAIRFGETGNNFFIQDYEISNNIFHASPNGSALFGIHIRGFQSAYNIKVINNIFLNFSYFWFESNRGDFFDTLYIQNNILFNNANNNEINFGGMPKNYFSSGNLVANPNFYSDKNFHPLSSSPSIGGGIKVPGSLYDKDGVIIGDPPNIGCYETIADLASPGYLSSVVDNDYPSIIEIAFNIPLLNIIPEISAFEVEINSKIVKINFIEVLEGKLLINLFDSVKEGDIITISYLKPDINPLQSIFNIDALNFIREIVKNNVLNKNQESFPTLKIFPNPILGFFTLIIEEVDLEEVSIFKIIAENGTIVHERSINSEMINSPISLILKPGVYIAQILSRDTIISTSKIIVIENK